MRTLGLDGMLLDASGMVSRPPETLRIVALGGGTGLPVVLRGLKRALFPRDASWHPRRDATRLTGVVTVADDGGSSGRLRRACGMIAPGDLRNCLLALADGDPRTAALFDFRFNGASDISGHSLGNLILTALCELERGVGEAVTRAGEILNIRGQIVPSTAANVTLLAEFDDGRCVTGESNIAIVRRAIRRVRLLPSGAPGLPSALEAVAAADLVVLGPGSLYTSVLPVLLVEDVARAIVGSRARVALVSNVMTEPGETDGYTAADFVRAIRRHVPDLAIHDVVVNTAPVPPTVRARYASDGSFPVSGDAASLTALGCRPVERDLIGAGPEIRHDPDKLARVLLELLNEV